MNLRWTITYRMSGPSELRFDGEVIAIGGSPDRHALLVRIAQTMNDSETRKPCECFACAHPAQAREFNELGF